MRRAERKKEKKGNNGEQRESLMRMKIGGRRRGRGAGKRGVEEIKKESMKERGGRKEEEGGCEEKNRIGRE